MTFGEAQPSVAINKRRGGARGAPSGMSKANDIWGSAAKRRVQMFLS
jgi:hypothetical protein